MSESQRGARRAKVSIGVPVFNGERYLSRAVDSVLQQEFQDWELLISDNGSTDSTRHIAQSYAEKDPRIRVRWFEENEGAVANFEAVFRETTAPFFMWLAFDDWLDPEYLSACLGLLEADATAVLAFTGMSVADDTGKTIRDREESLDGVESPNPVIRFHRMLWGLKDPTSPVFGLTRRSAMARTGLIRNSNEPDRVLLGELSLLGPIYQDKRRLFHHYGPGGHTDRDNWLWLNPRNRGKMRLATPRIVGYQAVAVWRSSHPLWQKWLMLVDLVVGSVALRVKGKAFATYRRWRKRRLAAKTEASIPAS